MTKKANPEMTAIEIRLLQYLEKREMLVVPASLREITTDMKISSTSVTNYYLFRLQKLGKIRRHKGKSRFIELVRE